MSLLLRVLGRLIVAVAGYVAASLAAGFTIVVAVAGWAATVVGEGYVPGLAPLIYAGGALGAYVIVLAIAPWIVIALVAEIFAIRSAFYYILAGGLTGALGYVGMSDYALRAHAMEGVADELMVFAAAGLVAGAVYWLVSGRSAGFRPAAAESG